ncbi:MAG: HAD-IB family phosphatase [Rickettsiales bacterium]|jgi:HAD superfamily phosphoserine phosphatase-like hydrolase|nr:HAD-IB family phosphatase [Rickettsiales bacterium]
MKKLVLFDYDGTLSAGDANNDFYRYTLRREPLRQSFHIPLLLIVKVGQLLNCKGIWWRHLLRIHITKEIVKKYAPGFIKEQKLKQFGWAKEQIAAEKKKGAICILLSASPDYLIKGLTKDLGLDKIICSRMDTARPWKIKELCYGQNKVNMLEAVIQPPYEVVRAYSDSRSDMPMMNIAEEQVWINPRTGIRR